MCVFIYCVDVKGQRARVDFLFHRVGPRYKPWVISHGGKFFYQLSHLTGSTRSFYGDFK